MFSFFSIIKTNIESTCNRCIAISGSTPGMSSGLHANASSNSLMSEINASLWVSSSFVPTLKTRSWFVGLNGISSISLCGTGRFWFSFSFGELSSSSHFLAALISSLFSRQLSFHFPPSACSLGEPRLSNIS
ncbi:hypothetical protein LIER_12952 [Lithospermum erythrorhizon]|uniref:Uncharacterized protein n=1 Tax=Lithospermum erythrorhizon TaxID=34254 RepID=A0AAV3PTQ1_LITER